MNVLEMTTSEGTFPIPAEFFCLECLVDAGMG